MATMHAYTRTGILPSRDTKTLVKVVPTVFIGLGGSGKQVLMWLRKRFHDRGVPSPNYAEFLFIDSDSNVLKPELMSLEDFNTVKPLEQETVSCPIDETSFSKTFDRVVAGIKADKFSWLEPLMKKLGPKTVQKGVGTYRQFGRMALYLHDQKVYSEIERRITSVLGVDGPLIDHDSVEVAIVTSLAGGTGSGVFLDVAYMVHSILQTKTLLVKDVTIYALMPTVFEGGDLSAMMPRFQQNAYAALLEVEYYGTPREGDDLLLGRRSDDASESLPTEDEVAFPTPWHPDPQVRRIAGTAWSDFYLIDNVNDLTSNVPLERDEVFQMTADYLFLDYENHQFASRKRSMRPNLVQYKQQLFDTDVESKGPHDPSMAKTEVVYATQTGCKYSAFGLAQIDFDVNRLYQAAGYRLASRLIAERWIGSASRDDELYKRWAQRDLLGDDDQVGAVSPSLRRLQLMRQLLARPEANWLDDALGEAKELEDINPAAGLDALEDVLANHDRQLHEPGGRIQKTIGDRHSEYRGSPTVLGPLRSRVRETVFGHISREGVAAATRLLGYYRTLLSDIVKRLKAAATEPTGADEALGRLREALRVGSLGRKIALEIEYPRAYAAVLDEIDQRYQRATQAKAEDLVKALYEYVGDPQEPLPEELTIEHGTLYGLCTRINEFLTGTQAQLDGRFQQSSTPDQLRTKRRQSLSAGWSPAIYDVQINRALLAHKRVGPSHNNPNHFDWEKLEALVMEELKKVESGGQFVRRADFLWYWSEQRQNDHGYAYIAEELARICEEIIRTGGLDLKDVADGNVVDLLWIRPDREDLVDQMVRSSAPYLPVANHPQISGHKLALSDLLGYKGGKHTPNTPAYKNAEEVIKLVKNRSRQATIGQQIDQEVEADETNDSSTLMLVREVAGFPLLFYRHLDQLHTQYRDTRPEPTQESRQSHIDRRLATFDLPDIRSMDVPTQVFIRDHVGMVLRGMLLGHIGWKEGQFQIELTDLRGSRHSQPLGVQLHRMIRYACGNEAVRKQLARHWSEWEGRPGAKPWACLFASAWKTYEILKAEAIRHSAETNKAMTESTPMLNCFSQLVGDLEQKLRKQRDGHLWIDAIKGQGLAMTSEGDGRALGGPSVLDTLVQDVMKPIRPDLPIYQLLHHKIEAVTLPGTGPAAQATSASAEP